VPNTPRSTPFSDHENSQTTVTDASNTPDGRVDEALTNVNVHAGSPSPATVSGCSVVGRLGRLRPRDARPVTHLDPLIQIPLTRTGTASHRDRHPDGVVDAPAGCQ
jgi:hypothetical protein